MREVFVAHSTSGFFDSAAFDLVSYGVTGAPTSTDSVLPSMSSNGRYVAFASGANNELSGVRTPTTVNVWMRDRPVVTDLHNATGVTAGKDGQIYVATGEPDNQVKVFSPGGKLVRAIGRPGGRRALTARGSAPRPADRPATTALLHGDRLTPGDAGRRRVGRRDRLGAHGLEAERRR